MSSEQPNTASLSASPAFPTPFPSSLSQTRKNVPAPIHITTMPMTPPDTPESMVFRSWPMSRNNSTSSQGSSSGGRRYSYSPTSPPSPLSLPPLMPEDDNEIDESEGILTPALLGSPFPFTTRDPSRDSISSVGSNGSSGNAFDNGAFEPKTPPPQPQREFKFASHSPLRKSLGYAKEDYFFSNPGTSSTKTCTLNGIPPHLSRKKSHLIQNPYYASPKTFQTTASYLLRVPRRMRPYVLAGFCLFVVTAVFFSRAVAQASQMDILMAQRRASLLERRYVEDGLMNIESADQADAGHEAVLEVEHAAVEAHPLIQFASTKDELLALIAFITATTANALPPIDPAVPLEPEAILDFDPSRDDATEDFEFVKTETNTVYPIVLFGKMRDPWHREIQKVLAEYKITPSPLVVDVDQRRDHLLITPLLARLFGTDELPQLVLAGSSLGSYHDILEMRDAGKLRSTLEASGLVSIRDIKKKKKGAKERERLDNERVLAPKPIVDGL